MFLGTDNNDLREGGNRGDNSSSQLDSSVDLINLEDVVSIGILSLNKGFHVVVDLLSTKMHVGSQQAKDVGLLSVRAHLPQIILIFNI